MANKIVVAVRGMVVHNGKVLIIQRSDDDAMPGIWEFPGGALEFGESLEDAAAREIKEETGLTVTVGRLLWVASFKVNKYKQIVFLTYHCTVKDTSVTLSLEHKSHLWASREQMEEFLPEDVVKHLNTVCVGGLAL